MERKNAVAARIESSRPRPLMRSSLPCVNLADSEISPFLVADRAGFAERRRHLVSVSGGVLAVVATQTS